MFLKVLLEKTFDPKKLSSEIKDKSYFENKEVHFLNVGMVDGYLYKEREDKGINNPLSDLLLPTRSINARTIELSQTLAKWASSQLENLKNNPIYQSLKEETLLTRNDKNQINLTDEEKKKIIEIASIFNFTYRPNMNLSALKAANNQLKAFLSEYEVNKKPFENQSEKEKDMRNAELRKMIREAVLLSFCGKPDELSMIEGKVFNKYRKAMGEETSKTDYTKLNETERFITEAAMTMRLGRLYSPMSPKELHNLKLILTKEDNGKLNGQNKTFYTIDAIDTSPKEEKTLLLGKKVLKAIERLGDSLVSLGENSLKQLNLDSKLQSA